MVRLNLVIFPSISLVYTKAPLKVIPFAVSGVITTGEPGTEFIMPFQGISSISITICTSPFSSKLTIVRFDPIPGVTAAYPPPITAT